MVGWRGENASWQVWRLNFARTVGWLTRKSDGGREEAGFRGIEFVELFFLSLHKGSSYR